MAAQNPHPMNAAVGRPFTINIPDCTIEDSYSVTWKKNNAESIVKVKMISDHASSPCASCTIHGNGSLTLHSAPAGRSTYNVEVYNNGKSVCLRTIEVTGQDAVDTPSINITCAEKKRVHVYCFISRGTNPKLQLIVQNVTLKKSQGNDLKYEGPLKTYPSSITCAAENLVSAEASTEMVNCDAGVWSRVVRVPSGPLLRVSGTDVAISCNVSNYEGPREQNFEWKYSSGAGPEVGVLSTWDPTFTDPSFSQRVSAGGIQLQRVGNSEVLLRIQQLRDGDHGNYTCYTPSTDETFSGNYHAHVWLTVIPDSLKLIGPRGRHGNVRNVTAGGTLQLQCRAALGDTGAHTHLSVTWERQSAGSASEVLTLTHLGRFRAGPEYERRYDDGELRLDTAGADLYRLTLDGVEEADAGEYSCVAGTWVQGPGGWEKIQEKRAAVAMVDVQPIELLVSVSDMLVELQDGAPLSLSCQVSLESEVGGAMIQVRWFRSQAGQVQELLGGLNPEPSSEKTLTHRLEVPQVRESGDYLCQGTAWTLLRNGSWNMAAQAFSSPISVQLLEDASDLQVSLNASVTPKMADEAAELVCHLSSPSHRRLSVSWYFTPIKGPDPSPVLLASMDQDWTLQVGEGHRQRLESGELSFTRRDPQTFTLRMSWTTEEDRGDYHCTATAWRQLTNDSWVPASHGTSPSLTITWETQGASLAVSARPVKMAAAAGGSFEMLCTVQPQNVPSPQYSVQVMVAPQGPSGAAPVGVISLSREGVTRRRLPSDSQTYLEKGKEGVYIFRLQQVQSQDIGAYRCLISAWTQGGGGAWRMVRNETTNPVQLEFQSSDVLFNVTARADSASVYRGERAEFWCIITIDGPALDPEDMSFEVSWYVQRPGGVVFLAGMERAAQVRHSRRNSSSEVSLERVSDMEYRLRVYGCEEEDAGGHYCAVTPWVRTGEGGWNPQETVTSSPVIMSVRMNLLSALTYPLLIGVGLSLLAGLISCLIGYCSSRYCCKVAPPVQEKRREHRRLMSMELD
ncbi:prostaglandin F2 receptor negative regulator [Gastrophryne carolinensis]